MNLRNKCQSKFEPNPIVIKVSRNTNILFDVLIKNLFSNIISQNRDRYWLLVILFEFFFCIFLVRFGKKCFDCKPIIL